MVCCETTCENGLLVDKGGNHKRRKVKGEMEERWAEGWVVLVKFYNNTALKSALFSTGSTFNRLTDQHHL